MGQTVRWVSAFVDVPAADLEAATAFWCAVTGSRPAPPFGDDREFVPLEPAAGHPCLWLQRVGSGSPACHVDLYVDDLAAAVADAQRLGAAVTRDGDEWVALSSPGGLPFCLVPHRDQTVCPEPVGDPASLVDQVCLDIPPSAYDAEVAFWVGLTGWEHAVEGSPEFERLVRPEGIPYAFLLQRLDDEQPAVSVHLDLACEDRDAESARHAELGAVVVRREQAWTVMRDPVGLTYCCTRRAPGDV